MRYKMIGFRVFQILGATALLGLLTACGSDISDSNQIRIVKRGEAGTQKTFTELQVLQKQNDQRVIIQGKDSVSQSQFLVEKEKWVSSNLKGLTLVSQLRADGISVTAQVEVANNREVVVSGSRCEFPLTLEKEMPVGSGACDGYSLAVACVTEICDEMVFDLQFDFSEDTEIGRLLREAPGISGRTVQKTFHPLQMTNEKNDSLDVLNLTDNILYSQSLVFVADAKLTFSGLGFQVTGSEAIATAVMLPQSKKVTRKLVFGEGLLSNLNAEAFSGRHSVELLLPGSDGDQRLEFGVPGEIGDVRNGRRVQEAVRLLTEQRAAKQ